jgi:hypothetical protein
MRRPTPLAEMADRLGVTQDWLRSEATSGRVPCLRAGTRFLFHAPTVERVLSERAAEAAKGVDRE